MTPRSHRRLPESCSIFPPLALGRRNGASRLLSDRFLVLSVQAGSSQFLFYSSGFRHKKTVSQAPVQQILPCGLR
jgi:hypothetical protein